MALAPKVVENEATPSNTNTVTDDVAFDAAFAGALEGKAPEEIEVGVVGEKPDEGAAPAPGEEISAGGESGPAEGAEESTPADSEGGAPAADGESPEVQPAGESATPPEESPELKAALARMTLLEEQLKQIQPVKADEPPKKEDEPPKAEELPKEDQEALDSFDKDWPEVSKAVSVQIKQLESRIEGLATLLESKVEQAMTAIKPAVVTAQQTAHDTFVSKVEEAHEGASAMLPDVEKWIGTLPATLQQAYNDVLDKGGVEDVVGLYDTYKKVTGWVAPKKADTPTKDLAKEKKLNSMEGVKTRSTGLDAEPDPLDFSGAFDAAIKET